VHSEEHATDVITSYTTFPVHSPFIESYENMVVTFVHFVVENVYGGTYV